jgi:hypothetical protein
MLLQGPTLTASGVATAVPRPTKIETELSPEFAVQILPLASTATPEGELSEPKPVLGEIAIPPENLDREPLLAN